MKSTSTRQVPPLAARALKLFALVFILSFFIDVLIQLNPFDPTFQPLNKAWVIGFVSQVVDRGIVPMVGIAFAIVGFWIEGVSGISRPKRKPMQDSRVWVLALSLGLGVVFAVMFPIHLSNVIQQRGEALKQINQRAAQAQEQVSKQLEQLGTQQAQTAIQQRKDQIKNQLSGLVNNQDQLTQLLQNDQLQPNLKQLLQDAQTDPAAIDKFVQDQFNPKNIRQRAESRIENQKDQAEDQAKTALLKAGIRTGLSSLLLAIGYIGIGWSGLQSMKVVGGGGRKKDKSKKS